MHRHPPGEEVDYVIVGVGAAGGVLLQGSHGRASRCSDWKPALSGIQRAIGSATRPVHTSFTGKTNASRGAKILSLSAPIIAAKGSAEGPFTGLHSRPGCIRLILKCTRRTESEWTGQFPIGISSLITNCSSWKCQWQARHIILGAIPMVMPSGPIPWAASATRLSAAAPPWNRRQHWWTGRYPERFTRQSPALHLSRLLYPRLQSRRESEHPGDARPRCDLDNGAEIRDRCMVSRIDHDKKGIASLVSVTSTRTARNASRRPRRSSYPATPSRRRVCC